MLRENPFISSPDLTKIRLRSNFKEKLIHPGIPKARNSDDNDEEYSRYSSDKTRKIQRMSMKTIPLKQTYSQPIAEEPQTQRAQDYNSLVMNPNIKPSELSQPKFEKNLSMKQIPPEPKFEEQKFETLRMNHVNSSVQGQNSFFNAKPVIEPQGRNEVIMVSQKQRLIKNDIHQPKAKCSRYFVYLTRDNAYLSNFIL